MTKLPSQINTSGKWVILTTDSFQKQISKIDRHKRVQIIEYLVVKLASADDPRIYGTPLKGNLATFWRYRVGDYRLFARIIDSKCVVNMIKVGHRKEVYEITH